MPDQKSPEAFPEHKDVIRDAREIAFATQSDEQQRLHRQPKPGDPPRPESVAARSLRVWREFMDESE